jgi:putative spermidine/putrescine transport system ATP-binding protein
MMTSLPRADDTPSPSGRGAERASNISVRGVGLTFPNGYVGLKETSLEIPAGSFCTLLGPSGSGKTTLLRAIAGLAEPTSGAIYIGDINVTSLPVQARNIGFVFQNYALFPHMTVAENIVYPLKLHGWSAADRASRTREILELIALPHVADSAVGDLSGGQQQRVAIGRALAYKPALLLLDEPMGALDRRLRQQLGAQLREIQQRTGITAVYVTHDQEEAFILSDQIAVMEKGEILQFSSPADLYFRPRSRFVAEFLGEANLVAAQVVSELKGGRVLARTALGDVPARDERSEAASGAETSVVIRPEAIKMAAVPCALPGHLPPLAATITHELFLGSRCLVTLRIPAGENVLIECPKAEIPQSGGNVWITWPEDAAVLVNH